MMDWRDRLREAILSPFRKVNGTLLTLSCFVVIFLMCCRMNSCDAGLLGYYPGNDSLAAVQYATGNSDLFTIGKIEVGRDRTLSYEGDGDHFGIRFKVYPTFEGEDYAYYLAALANPGSQMMSGDIWQQTASTEWTPLYYVAKAAKGWNLYAWESENLFQKWTTYNLCSDMSHITVYGETSAVPEPSSFLLLGLCFGLGLAWKKWSS